MYFVGIAVAFIYGLLFGSFYNVVGMRGVKGEESYAKGRSHCVTCDRTLNWYELVPVLSWAVQGGRCRGCKQRISWIYPVIEFLTGVLFGVSYAIFQISIWLPIALVISSALVIFLVRVLERRKLSRVKTFSTTV